jgi:hypothetical protein
MMCFWPTSPGEDLSDWLSIADCGRRMVMLVAGRGRTVPCGLDYAV